MDVAQAPDRVGGGAPEQCLEKKQKDEGGGDEDPEPRGNWRRDGSWKQVASDKMEGERDASYAKCGGDRTGQAAKITRSGTGDPVSQSQGENG